MRTLLFHISFHADNGGVIAVKSYMNLTKPKGIFLRNPEGPQQKHETYKWKALKVCKETRHHDEDKEVEDGREKVHVRPQVLAMQEVRDYIQNRNTRDPEKGVDFDM